MKTWKALYFPGYFWLEKLLIFTTNKNLEGIGNYF
jgi:hypothetical protein